MPRRLVLVSCLGLFVLLMGCGGNDERVNNPNNLEYSKEGPGKRDAPSAPKQ